MLKIRLRRMGSRHQPFYRVVVSDSRRTPTASAVDEIGFYDPRRQPSLFTIDRQRYEHWLGNGAQVSGTLRKLVSRAPVAPAPAVVSAPAAVEAPVVEAPVVEAPVVEAPVVEASAADETVDTVDTVETTAAAADDTAPVAADEGDAPAAEAEAT